MKSLSPQKLNFNPINKTIIVMLVVLISACGSENKSYEYPFQDPDLSVEKRVDDLVGRMTLDEKISQMMNQSPAIERLGIPEYNWWSEGLHGVARAGIATVFPQAIGLGAMWDEEELFNVSNAISDEARAKHHNFAKNNKRFLYQGLTLWSPNINIFRDPRWGRGQETYGEDPYLTGMLGIQFVKGLQGNDTTYYKTIATIKHFAVHSGPEPERHEFDAIADVHDMLDTYFPQFEMGVKQGGAYSVMCAYNRLNGEACCGSDGLLNTILRNDWGFTGFVVSDCGAIEDIYAHHKIVSSPEAAAAIGVKSGTDLNCGVYYANLKQAVEKGLITEAEIDVAVKRLFTARFKLGMFDPEEQVKYASIPYSVVDSKENQALALEAARKSIVLLKNEKSILPLKKDTYKTIGVIGPNSDQWLMLLGNYNGVPSHAITPLQGIKDKVGKNTNVLFAQGSELAEGMPMFYVVPSSALTTAEGNPGINVEYFNNIDLSGEPLYKEVTKNLDANWVDKAPREDMDDDHFSVRWKGSIKPDLSGNYQLGFIGTCNTKLYLNDSLIAFTEYHFRDEYGDPRLRRSDPIRLEAGVDYKIRIDAIETYADAQVELVWAQPKPQLRKNAIEVAKQSDVVIMCMGLTPRMEGEEMDVKIDGFRGGDRTDIILPKVQEDLIKEIHALGKPVILVLLNGSALAINWENKNIPAIVEAWYPGQAAGQAIADVLFGDYNPAGRLPVTFYKSIKDLPSFDDYHMTSQTYRYFKGEPLYPFGYGLSYTTFQYSNLSLPETSTTKDSISVSVELKNTGARDGDEVVQLYISSVEKFNRGPIRSLKGFKRIHLKSGETTTVTFKLAASAFTIVNEDNKRVVVPGSYEISVGGGQPLAGQQVVKKVITLQ